MEDKVTIDTPIEDLVLRYPQAVKFLARKNLRCIRCGEPVWSTVGEFLREEGVESPEELIKELNQFLEIET